MAEPKKETVRIALPPRPEHAGAIPSAEKRDTAGIVLPSRTPPATSIRRPPANITPLAAPEAAAGPLPAVRRPPLISQSAPIPSPLLNPLPKPPGAEGISRVCPTPIRESAPTPAPSNNIGGPEMEPARISVLPRPIPHPGAAIDMTKTQPLLPHPAAGVQPAPVVITSRPLARTKTISRPLCWMLFGTSVVIFLIQIWNYVVS